MYLTHFVQVEPPEHVSVGRVIAPGSLDRSMVRVLALEWQKDELQPSPLPILPILGTLCLQQSPITM